MNNVLSEPSPTNRTELSGINPIDVTPKKGHPDRRRYCLEMTSNNYGHPIILIWLIDEHSGKKLEES